MKKTFVIDTNVLLQSPYALFHFEDNDVVIPAVVLEELDKFKKDSSELGANARETSRILDKLRITGNISEGIKLDSGGFLRIELNCENVKLPECWDPKKNDNRVLKVCLGLKDEGLNIILVSKDIFERIKAEIIGVTAQAFSAEQVPNYDEHYSGRSDVYTTEEVIDNLEILMDADNKDKFNHKIELRDKIQKFFDRNIINTEAIAFIRGRSIVKSTATN